MFDFECTIVGAGVVGLAVARSIGIKNRRVLILEKNTSFGEENSSRNSGVIHAGIYYPRNSLKSKFCIEGKKKLYKYAKERSIDYNNCGKILIANNNVENKKLEQIKDFAEKSGITLKKLNFNDIKKIEPEIQCKNGLLSKTTGIIDSHGLMTNFITDIEQKKGIISYKSKISSINLKENHVEFYLNDIADKKYTTKLLINCAGINSEKIARMIKKFPKFHIPSIRFVRGNYMKISGKNPFSRLIYPIPNKDGLGIHSTLNLANETLFGPDTENISKIDFKPSTGLNKKFTKAIKRYWPGITNRNLYPDYSGIRTKVKNNDFIIQDFRQHKIKNIINLFGIESPGLTSSMSIGEYVSNIAEKTLNDQI